jgi:signal recognition particle subunit SRP54
MQGIMGLLPGVQKVKKQIAESGVSDKTFSRQEAIIGSMTPGERKKPDVLNGSRKRRIAAGAGVEVMEINRLLKQHRQMADTFKAMSRDGGKSMARMAQMMGGGMPGMGGMGGGKAPSQEELAKAMDQLKGGGSLPGLGGGPKLPGQGLSGLGGGLPPGFPFKK